MFKACIVSLGLLISCSIWSFTCNLTAMKSNCWSNSINELFDFKAPPPLLFDVTIDVYDKGAETPVKLATIVIPAKENMIKQSFTCQPSQIITYEAHFFPTLWEKDKNKSYKTRLIKSLPDSIKPGEIAWELSICFANDFIGVTESPLMISTCQCSSSNIPVIDRDWVLPLIKEGAKP